MDEVSNIHDVIADCNKRCISPIPEQTTTKKTKTDLNVPTPPCNSGFEGNESAPTCDRTETNLLNNNRNAIDSVPSTSNCNEKIPSNSIGPAHQPIKLETIEPDDNANIKTEPEESTINMINIPIKIEVKDEPIENLTAAPDTSQTQSNEHEHATQRECCKYGIRCYRFSNRIE